MTEIDELLTDLKAVFGKLNPRRDPETMPNLNEIELAMLVLLRREIRMAKPSSVANLRQRCLDRIANHSSKDPE